MDSSPLNLIDGSATTDWTGEAGASGRIRARTGGAEPNCRASPLIPPSSIATKSRLGRSASNCLDTSARSGFVPILAADLKMKKDGQELRLDPEHALSAAAPTIASNYGDDYTGFTGFHGYGRPLTATATLPDVTGRYEGWSGWGTLNLTQSGDTVTGCYEYQAGRHGPHRRPGIDARHGGDGPDGAPRRLRGYFGLTSTAAS